MHFRHYFNASISLVLSAGLILWPSNGRAFDQIYAEGVSLEELGLQELGLDKDIKKLLKPVQELNVNSGIQTMAMTAVRFLRDLNKLTGNKFTVDTGLHETALVLHKNNMPVDANKFRAIQKLLNQAQKALCVDDNLYALAKEFGNIDHMSDREILGYVFIFCGCLLCILPTGFTQGLGTGCISLGVYEVMQGGYEEAKRRR